MTQMSQVLEQIKQCPATSFEISQEIGVQQSSVATYLKTLLDMDLIKIVGMVKHTGKRRFRLYESVQ